MARGSVIWRFGDRRVNPFLRFTRFCISKTIAAVAGDNMLRLQSIP
jgi:hypothetical protein